MCGTIISYATKRRDVSKETREKARGYSFFSGFGPVLLY